jgi:hypothetical protein
VESTTTTTLPPNPAIDDLYQANDAFGLGHGNGHDNFSLAGININVFDGLDANFDLSRVNTLFSTTLNPTVPLVPTDWMDL